MMERVIRILVVDDSAYVRKTISQILSQVPSFEVVGTARDGADALEQVRELQPDVVTVDLIMPGMDGAEFTRRVMEVHPVPVVVVSIASESSERVLAALDAGAIDFVQKPTALATEKVFEMSEELVGKIRVAAQASLVRVRPQAAAAAAAVTAGGLVGAVRRGVVDIVVIGISTGGPQALKALIPQLQPDFPVPVAIVLHMPVGYTEMYAQRLDEASALTVREAAEDVPVHPGMVLIAPAGRHLTFRRTAAGDVVTHLDLRPLDTPHRPSVDILFHSAAEVYGGRVLGVIMTGMGADGREGAAWIKAAGGCILTEAEESCVVYGMPRSVVEAGLSDASVALEALPQAILERL
jgi:two-component system, chemotaxis family, protein-glutamate methylesterase/glutaminase